VGTRDELDRDVAGRSLDPRDAAASTGAPALHDRAFVDVRGSDDELVADQAVIRLGVRDRGAQDLLDLARGGALGEGEHRPRVGDAAPADVLRDQSRLAGRHAHPLRHGTNLCATRSRISTHQPRLTSVLRSPEWPRKLRVGANSPSLWPTICSLMK